MPRRATIGIIGWLLLIVGVSLFFFGSKADAWVMIRSGCVRVGVVMVMLWLAYRDVSRVPTWLYGCTFVVLIVIAVRPRYIVYLGPPMVAAWLLRPRPSKNDAIRMKEQPPSDPSKPSATGRS